MYIIKSLSNKLYLMKQLYGLCIKEGIAVLYHLNFFNKVINKFLAVNVKIDEEDKMFILLNSLPQSYDHIITIMLYGKKILILEEVMTTLLSNEIRKRSNQEEQGRIKFGGYGKERKGEERKSSSSSKTCPFVTGKVTGRMTASIGKSD